MLRHSLRFFIDFIVYMGNNSELIYCRLSFSCVGYWTKLAVNRYSRPLTAPVYKYCVNVRPTQHSDKLTEVELDRDF